MKFFLIIGHYAIGCDIPDFVTTDKNKALEYFMQYSDYSVYVCDPLKESVSHIEYEEEFEDF